MFFITEFISIAICVFAVSWFCSLMINACHQTVHRFIGTSPVPDITGFLMIVIASLMTTRFETVLELAGVLHRVDVAPGFGVVLGIIFTLSHGLTSLVI
jgi:hypothetical protein